MVARLPPTLEELNRCAPESVFAKVAELGSFRRAALVLGLSVGVVTGTVRALERRRGRPLLVRAGGSLAVLPDGAALLRSLDGEPTAAEANPAVPEAHGTLDVNVCASQSRLLLHALPLFAARNPRLRVRLYSTAHESPRSPVDAVLRLGEPGPVAVGLELLGTYRVVTCASPAYLAERGVPHSPDELSGHRSVPAGAGATDGVRPLRFCGAAAPLAVTLDYVIAAGDLATQLAAAAAGLGITQVPLTREVRGRLTQRRLVPILEAYEPDGVPILLGRQSDLRPAFAAFRDWLADLYRSECLALSPRR